MPLYELGNIVNATYARLDNNQVLYTQQEVINEINFSIQLVNLYTGFIQLELTTLTVPWSAANTIYTIPSGILYPTRMIFEGKPLKQHSFLELARLYRSWATDTTKNAYPVAHWASIDMTTFVIHPADALGGNSLEITGVAEPVPLVSLTDVITMPDEVEEIIESLTAYTLAYKQGASEFKRSMEMFKAFLSRMKKMSRWSANVTPRLFLPKRASEPAQDTGVEAAA
jgi:hypothetical protein